MPALMTIAKKEKDLKGGYPGPRNMSQNGKNGGQFCDPTVALEAGKALKKHFW